MRNLAPDILRQRLLIEGYTTKTLDREAVGVFLVHLAGRLGLRAYDAPAIFSPQGAGAAGSQGFDAFLPLVDSGISLYYWSQQRFVAVLLFTCKALDRDAAIACTRDALGLEASPESLAF